MDLTKKMTEVNFDCLTGPTHFFGGLSLGNLASHKSKMKPSNPKKAFLQGLKKMKLLSDLGFKQAILPPHPRPNFPFLNILGFSGSDQNTLKKAFNECPKSFFASLSSSFMWAANMATVSPFSDCLDKKVHFTLANLSSMLHRSLEADFSYKILKDIFFDDDFFIVHAPIFRHDVFSDEGAANHMRLSKSHCHMALEIFAYGKDLNNEQKSKVYHARQSILAQKIIARNHKIKHAIFIEQSPKAIDSGAFHNDVVAVVNENVILCHEWAFYEQKNNLSSIKNKYYELFLEYPFIIEIKNELLPIEDAVNSYLFNSQLLTKTDGHMILLAPIQAKNNPKSLKAIDWLLAQENPIKEVEYSDVTESMDNGGGPACLRLRVLLNDLELKKVKDQIFFSPKLNEEFLYIANNYYETEFNIEKSFCEKFLKKSTEALDAIYYVLGLSDLLDEFQM